MTNSWQQEKEKGSHFAVQTLAWIALHLGRRVIFFILCFTVAHYFLVATKARKASREFLTRALNRPPRWKEIYFHFLNFAIVSVDRFYFLKGRQSIFDIQVHGKEIFSNYQDRGCFLVTSHLGSFDALRSVGMGALKKRLALRILLDVKHNANALAVIQTLDPELAKCIIDARTPAPELALILNEAINNGEWIGIMADRCTDNDRSQPFEFLGKSAQFPVGVWQLASLLQAPVISCVGIFAGSNRYELYFELIADRIGTSRKNRAAAVLVAMQTYTDLLGKFARKYPFNWFNFFDFWSHESTEY